MPHVTPDELIEFVHLRGQLELHTLLQKHPFTAQVAGDGFQYLPQTGAPRSHGREYLALVCEEFSRTNSFSAGDYYSITMNASYTLPLIQAYLDSRSTTG